MHLCFAYVCAEINVYRGIQSFHCFLFREIPIAIICLFPGLFRICLLTVPIIVFFSHCWLVYSRVQLTVTSLWCKLSRLYWLSDLLLRLWRKSRTINPELVSASNRGLTFHPPPLHSSYKEKSTLMPSHLQAWIPLRIVGPVSGTVSIWILRWPPQSMPSSPNSRKNNPFLYTEVYCCKVIHLWFSHIPLFLL